MICLSAAVTRIVALALVFAAVSAYPALAQEEATPAPDATAPTDETGDDAPEAVGEPTDEPTDQQPSNPELTPAPESDAVVEPALEGIVAKVVQRELTNPTGIAVRPGASKQRAELFIADSGAYRIVRYETDKPDTLQNVVTDFPQGSYGKGPAYSIGPLGVEFLNRKTLIVGGGGRPDGEELVQVYQIDDESLPLKADAPKESLGPIPKGTSSSSGEGNFYAIARNSDGIYVTANGDDEFGWVLRAEVRAGMTGRLKTFIATKKATGVNAPCGATFSGKGYLVVGQMGTIDKPSDSLITFYNPYDGDAEPALNLTTKLHDIVALAYSPTTGDLYVADFSWANSAEGGIYRIDAVIGADSKMSCTEVLVARVTKPTALAFSPDGSLWCTAFGDTEGPAEPTGVLIQILGSEEKPL